MKQSNNTHNIVCPCVWLSMIVYVCVCVNPVLMNRSLAHCLSSGYDLCSADTLGARSMPELSHWGEKRKQLSTVHKTFCTTMIFHFWDLGSTQNGLKWRKTKERSRRSHAECSTEWAAKPFWKQQNRVILEKPEGGGGGGGGDILDCQQNSAAQPLVPFVGGIKNVCVAEIWLWGKLHSSL